MNPGDLIAATLPGAVETKVRPAVVIASPTLSGRTSRCQRRHLNNQGPHLSRIYRLSLARLAARRTACLIMFSCIYFDASPFPDNGDWETHRARSVRSQNPRAQRPCLAAGNIIRRAKKLNIGVTAWASMDDGSSDISDCWWTHDIGYAKIGEQWRILRWSASAPTHCSEVTWGNG